MQVLERLSFPTLILSIACRKNVCMQYLPFLSGIYSVAPGLIPISKAISEADKLIFQVDEYYDAYLDNKKACRNENINKYCCTHDLLPSTINHINTYLIDQLQKEYPSIFQLSDDGKNCQLFNTKTNECIGWNKTTMQLHNDEYASLFDALCFQVQEDFAICQLENDKDWMAAIHLCAPNHWSPQEKIGRSFDAVHAPVAGMEKSFHHYFKMLESIVQKGPFTRFAWGVATDNRLNHHPEPPVGAAKTEWEGRQIDDTAQLFIRTERQNLVGFPEVNAFLFTIRTYFYAIDDLSADEKKQLQLAVQSMSPEALAYKGLTNGKDILLKRLATAGC